MDNQNSSNQNNDQNNDQNNNTNNRNGSLATVRMGTVFLPLMLNYIVSWIVQFIFWGVILFTVVSNYVYQTEDYAIMMEEAETMEFSDVSEVTDSIDALMTDEVIDELTLQTVEIVEDNLALLTVFSSLACIPLFLWLMYRDKKKRFVNGGLVNTGLPMLYYGFVVVGCGCLGLALNNILTLSQLAEISQSYQETSDTLYSLSFPMQIIGIGVIVPIAEELLFRGVLHKRLRYLLKPSIAIFWSSLIFGAYHGNVVQFIYAFLCGIALAWSYEKFGTVVVPILGHICMNLVSLILTQYDLFVWMFADPIRMTVITVSSATIAATCYVLFINRIKETPETV